jgi:hypothetical protein
MNAVAVLEDYCKLMESIKARTDVMLKFVQNPSLLPALYVAEIHQLQIRMICETLAIACLLVHGDVEGARSGRLATAYQADLIMNGLEKLHPRFYPRPIQQTVRGGLVVAIDGAEGGFMTKEKLLRSYRATGEFLHVGDLTDFLAKKQRTFDQGEIVDWVRHFIALLNCHTIYLADEPSAWGNEGAPKFLSGEPAPKRQILVNMTAASDDKPKAKMFETVGPAPLGPWPPAPQ